MGKKSFFVLVVALGLVYIAAAGTGFFQKKSGGSATEPKGAEAEFSKKFGWLKARPISADDFPNQPGDPGGAFHKTDMTLVFTPEITSCELTNESKEKRSLQLTCPEGASLKVIAPRPGSDGSVDVYLPTNRDGQPYNGTGEKYSDASWELKPGDTISIECTEIPKGSDECVVRIGDQSTASQTGAGGLQ